jgi:hypothetical protein
MAWTERVLILEDNIMQGQGCCYIIRGIGLNFMQSGRKIAKPINKNTFFLLHLFRLQKILTKALTFVDSLATSDL